MFNKPIPSLVTVLAICTIIATSQAQDSLSTAALKPLTPIIERSGLDGAQHFQTQS